jgi:hypothetical protein
MRSHSPKRKLLFPSGLISLTVLPFFYCSFFYDIYNYRPPSVIELIYPDLQDSICSPLKYVSKRFTKIYLTGKNEDAIKLQYAQIAIREMLHEKDSTLGIEFQFKDHTKYWELVRLLDICAVENAGFFFNDKYKFYVLNLKRDPCFRYHEHHDYRYIPL